MKPNFEADLTPPDAGIAPWPRVRFNFANGWSASVVLRTDAKGMDAKLAALAACPTGQWKKGKTELGHHEALPDEVAAFLVEVAGRPKP